MLRNWDNHLVDWASYIEGSPFEWGAVDCLSTVLTGLALMYGDEAIRMDAWNDRETFVRAVEAAGGPLGLLERHCDEINPKRLRTGDIVWTPDGCDETDFGAVSLVVRDVQVVVTPENGVQLLPLKFPENSTGWRYAPGR
jgi:hypothetical protein